MAVAEPTPGPRLGAATVPTHAAEGGRASLSRGLRAARALLDRVAPGREPIAVGVSTIGIPRESGVDLAPNIPGWADLALAKEIQAAFPASVVRVETDVKAAARVEAVEGALKDADPGLYLNLGTGLAVAIVTKGEVIAGRNGAAGRDRLQPARAGRRRRRRRRALDPRGPGQRHRPAGPGQGDSSRGPPAPRTCSPRRVQDPRAAEILREFTDELAFHLVNLAIAVDPARIAVGGGMVRSWPVLYGPLRRALDAAVPFPPDLVQAAFPFDAPLAGALALARAAARDIVPARPKPPRPQQPSDDTPPVLCDHQGLARPASAHALRTATTTPPQRTTTARTTDKSKAPHHEIQSRAPHPATGKEPQHEAQQDVVTASGRHLHRPGRQRVLQHQAHLGLREPGGSTAASSGGSSSTGATTYKQGGTLTISNEQGQTWPCSFNPYNSTLQPGVARLHLRAADLRQHPAGRQGDADAGLRLHSGTPTRRRSPSPSATG